MAMPPILPGSIGARTRFGAPTYPDPMLEATKTSVWRRTYRLDADGQPLATWEGRLWRSGGVFDLAGRHYEVTANPWGSRFTMTDQFGMTVASAERVGRKRWTVAAGGRDYQFQRASILRKEERLVEDGKVVGAIRRRSAWRGDAVADLPGLPLPVQVFVLGVVLTKWDLESAAATSG
jgi:hypothetical protein